MVLKDEALLEKYRNLEGEQFGSLTVLSCESDKTETKGYCNLKWLCQCKCGKTKVILGYLLINGLNKSCGCEMRKPRMIHIGERIGHLTIIGRKGKHWVCRCDCGKEVIKSPQFIHRPKSSTIPDCGEHDTSKKHMSLMNDLAGMQIGEWDILERDYSYTGQHVKYICKSRETGETKSLFSFYLSILQKKEENNRILGLDLLNQQFGDLTVVRRFTEKYSTFYQYYNKKLYKTSYRKKTKYPQWVCKCACGNLVVYTSKDLLDREITHCGCKGKLKKNGKSVLFTQHKSTKDNTKYEGLKLGWLQLVKEVEGNDVDGRRFLCKCKCGNEKIISLRNLKTGICSCGCLKLKENRGHKEELLKRSREAWKNWRSKN